MVRSIHRLGLVGATLAFLLIAGLNLTALNRQWDVPYVGMQKANASGTCAYGFCVHNGRLVYGCWKVSVQIPNPCSTTCSFC